MCTLGFFKLCKQKSKIRYFSGRRRNLTVDDVIRQLDDSDFDLSGSEDDDSANESYQPIINDQDVDDQE